MLGVSANNTNRLYGAANPAFTASYSGFVNGDTASVLSGAPSLTTSATAASPVGNYTVTNSTGTLSATNYTFSFTNGTLTVNPATLMASANNTNRTYGTTNPVFTASYLGFLNGDTAGVLSGTPILTTTATTNSPIGAYVISNTPGTLSAANYTITYTNGLLTVTPATLTLTASNQSKVYGQTFNFAGTEFSTAGLLNSDTVTNATLNSAGSPAGAGVSGSPYNITITNAAGTGLTNYSINYVTGQLTVTRALLGVTVNNTNRIYGATDPVFTVSYNGFVNGDTQSALSGSPSLTTSATTNSPAGGYTITNSPGTLSAANYSFSFTNGTLTVNPAGLTVAVNNLSRAYGATNPLFTVSYLGFVNGDTTNVLSGSLGALITSANTNIPTGNYVITNTPGTLSAANYTIGYSNGVLTVTQAILTVTANIISRTYGATNPPLTVSYSGFVSGDTTNILSGSPSLATSAATNSPVGNYTITVTNGTLNAPNYTLAFVNGTLTVTQAVLTVTANNTNRIYGATNPVFTASYTGFVNNDTTSVLSGQPSLTTTAVTNSPTGAYTITATNGDVECDQLHVQLCERHAQRWLGDLDGDGEQHEPAIRRGESGVHGELQWVYQRRHE